MKAFLSAVMLFSSVARLVMGAIGLSLLWHGQYLEGSAVVSAAALSRISLDLSFLRIGHRSPSDLAAVDLIVSEIRR